MNIAEKTLQLKQDFDEVYEAGKKAGYDALWDNFQNYGNRTYYSHAFAGHFWNTRTFYPKYDLKVTNGSYMFANWDIGELRIFNLTERLNECGVVLDTSECTDFACFFQYGSARYVPVIDTRSAKTLNNFSVNSSLYEVEKIILKDDGSQIVKTMFSATHTGLIEVRFEGVIGSDINMSTCPVLSVASMKNIISCLKNYKGTDKEFAYQCKFTSDCWAALEADSTSPTGTTWAEYVDSLGWLT